MTIARQLTISCSALNLQNGVRAEIFIKRATNTDSFIITPELRIPVTLVNGDGTVMLPPTTNGSIKDIVIYASNGNQLFRVFFYMPDDDVELQDLDLFTAWPNAENSSSTLKVVWGNILGTLSNQTDLWNVLQGKQDNIVAGTVAQYWRGDKTWQDLTIGAVAGLQTLIEGLIDTIAGKEPVITAGTEGQFFSWDKSWRTITIDLVSGLNGALNGKEPTITGGTTAQYWRGDKSWATLNIAAVENLQTTLDGKESSIATGTTAQYWRGDKTWQTLNIAAVENLQTTLNGKLENLESPAATGTALNMAKSGVFGRLKKIITSGTDLSLSDATDLVTITLAGSTLKLWAEAAGVVSSKIWRSFKPVRQGGEANTTAIDAFLSGLHASGLATSNDNHYYAVTFADPAGTFGGISLGRGANDLQIYRTATANCASGAYAVALGANNLVSGANSIAISAQKTLSQVTGANSVFIGDQATVSGQYNFIGGSGGGNLITVSGNYNYSFGYSNISGSTYSVLGNTNRTLTANNNIVLSGVPVLYGSIDDRGIKGVYVWSCSRKVNQNTNPQQQYNITLIGSTPNTNTGVWVTTTTADLLAGEGITTTNTYKMVAAGVDMAVCFNGFARISSNLGLKIFKIEGRYYGSSQTLDVTIVDNGGTTSDPTHGAIQIVKSGQQLYLQFKVDATIVVASDIHCRAMLFFTELGS